MMNTLSRRHFGLVFAVATGLLVSASAWLLAQPATQPTGGNSGEKVTTASGLTITKVAPGSGAKEGDLVYVMYTGKFTDGTVFDASSKHGNEPVPVKLGAAQVIKGWEEGLLGTQVGEKFHLIVPPDLAYGAKGKEKTIPPNATLEFDMEVTGIVRQ